MSNGLTVILTHEHTDFDALAAMLAAWKLHPEALPVLPRQLNRNVREFLTLYRNALPFITTQDLPTRRIDHAIVVDTQSFAPVRRMAERTTIEIIDHHELQRQPLPEHWTYRGESVGATTTLLVETLIARGIDVSSVEATCLLLGIYEDSGSLTYASTTARDAACVSWLLQPGQGANLEVAVRFLHHPLSEDQQRLLQQLLANSEPYEFGGQPVIIAWAGMSDFNDEISTLAHRVRDMYEPAAVFLLVQLEDRIQLVARSASDLIDVGAIAAEVGGGGHPRAAAALIRGQTLHAVREQVLELLRKHVQPAATVAQIMSWGVQTLRPDITIADAAARMTRFGFEGYPVADEGKVVGIVTRRQVDLSLRHQLSQSPVAQVMSRGSVSVTPQDSIDVLQRRMMESSWGQIPVVDPQTGDLVGIVTRTDLIKLWGEPKPTTRAAEINAHMEALLPVALLALLRRAGDAAEQLHYPLYAVGGFVRDLLLSRPNFDIDLVVEGDAIALARRLAKNYGGRVRSHRRFGTAKWILAAADEPDRPQQTAPQGTAMEDEEEEEEETFVQETDGQSPLATSFPVRHLDFVTARTEFYEHPSALPTVERSSIKLDLHRRDFTLNTLAVRLDPGHWGELLDFYNGEEDLRNGVVRVLHSLSFIEDPTRVLRAVRFEQRFGFQIEPRTEQLVADVLDLLGKVSPARVRHELELILQEDEPELALARLQQLAVLEAILPNLTYDRWLAERFIALRTALAERRPPDALPRLYFALWLYRLDPDADRALNERLRLGNDTRRLIDEVRVLQRSLGALSRPALPPSEIDGLLQSSSEAARLVVHTGSESWVVRQRIDLYDRSLRRVKTELDGHRLRSLGIPPGPIYRTILSAVRAARLDGHLHTLDDEVAMARELQEAASREQRVV